MAAENEIENEKLTQTTPNQSPSNSQGSSTHPTPPISLVVEKTEKEEGRVEQEEQTTKAKQGMEKGGSSSSTNNKSQLPDSLQCFTADEIAKFNKYEADYASYLRAKLFSNKDISGSDIFDLTVKIGNESIKASRTSPTESYADPQHRFAFGRVVASREGMPSASSGVNMSPNIPNGSQAPQKKGT